MGRELNQFYRQKYLPLVAGNNPEWKVSRSNFVGGMLMVQYYGTPYSGESLIGRGTAFQLADFYNNSTKILSKGNYIFLCHMMSETGREVNNPFVSFFALHSDVDYFGDELPVQVCESRRMSIRTFIVKVKKDITLEIPTGHGTCHLKKLMICREESVSQVLYDFNKMQYKAGDENQDVTSCGYAFDFTSGSYKTVGPYNIESSGVTVRKQEGRHIQTSEPIMDHESGVYWSLGYSETVNGNYYDNVLSNLNLNFNASRGYDGYDDRVGYITNSFTHGNNIAKTYATQYCQRAGDAWTVHESQYEDWLLIPPFRTTISRPITNVGMVEYWDNGLNTSYYQIDLGVIHPIFPELSNWTFFKETKAAILTLNLRGMDYTSRRNLKLEDSLGRTFTIGYSSPSIVIPYDADSFNIPFTLYTEDGSNIGQFRLTVCWLP